MKPLIVTWVLGGGAAWVFSAAVRSLPEPLPGERFYLFVFRFCHILGANFDKVESKP